MDKVILESLTYETFHTSFNRNMEEIDRRYVRNQGLEWEYGFGKINVFVLRCNGIYITNAEQRNNDFLVIVQNPERVDGSPRIGVFNVTADPKFKKPNIANLLPQVYYGNIRNHHWTTGRLCIAQDFSDVYVRRFPTNNQDVFKDEAGIFGINIHDNGGFFNSSLGCIILASQQDNIWTYQPLLKQVKLIQERNIPVSVIPEVVFATLL